MRKQKFTLKSIVVIVTFAFMTAGFSAAVNAARINPSGKVFIIQDGKVVGEFSREAPLPEDAFLRCEGECTVTLDDAYMAAEPDTVFSLKSTAASHELTVRSGTVYFSVSETSRPLAFSTPAGDATTRDISMTGNELRGYVRVSGRETEIGVIDGGTMMVATSSGTMAVTPGNQVTIAMVDPDASAAAAGNENGSSLLTDVALGVAQAAVLVTGIYLLTTIGGSNSNNKSSGSPAAP